MNSSAKEVTDWEKKLMNTVWGNTDKKFKEEEKKNIEENDKPDPVFTASGYESWRPPDYVEYVGNGTFRYNVTTSGYSQAIGESNIVEEVTQKARDNHQKRLKEQQDLEKVKEKLNELKSREAKSKSSSRRKTSDTVEGIYGRLKSKSTNNYNNEYFAGIDAVFNKYTSFGSPQDDSTRRNEASIEGFKHVDPARVINDDEADFLFSISNIE